MAAHEVSAEVDKLRSNLRHDLDQVTSVLKAVRAGHPPRPPPQTKRGLHPRHLPRRQPRRRHGARQGRPRRLRPPEAPTRRFPRGAPALCGAHVGSWRHPPPLALTAQCPQAALDVCIAPILRAAPADASEASARERVDAPPLPLRNPSPPQLSALVLKTISALEVIAHEDSNFLALSSRDQVGSFSLIFYLGQLLFFFVHIFFVYFLKEKKLRILIF